MDSLERTYSNCVRRITLKQLNVVIILAFFVLLHSNPDLLNTVYIVSIGMFSMLAIYYVLNLDRSHTITSKTCFLTIVALMLFYACRAAISLRHTLSDVLEIVFENEGEVFASKLIDYVQRTVSTKPLLLHLRLQRRENKFNGNITRKDGCVKHWQTSLKDSTFDFTSRAVLCKLQ